MTHEPRFTLHPGALAWIERGIELSDNGRRRASDDELGAPDWGASWSAAVPEDGAWVHELIQRALAAGIIADASPPGNWDEPALAFEFAADDGVAGEDIYRWSLRGTVPGAMVMSPAADIAEADGGVAVRGAQSALAMLQEAVEAGNDLNAGLHLYASSQR